MTRTATNKLLQMVEDGLLDKDIVIQACLEYMSEEDVKDMMVVNDFGDVDEDFSDGYQDYDDEDGFDRDFSDPEDDNY